MAPESEMRTLDRYRARGFGPGWSVWGWWFGVAASAVLLVLPPTLDWGGLHWERITGTVAGPVLLGIAVARLGRVYGWRWVKAHPDADAATAASEYRRRRLWWAGVTACVAFLPALLPAFVVISWFGFFIHVEPGHGSPWLPFGIFWGSLALAAILLGAGLVLVRRHAATSPAQP